MDYCKVLSFSLRWNNLGCASINLESMFCFTFIFFTKRLASTGRMTLASWRESVAASLSWSDLSNLDYGGKGDFQFKLFFHEGKIILKQAY